MDLCGVNPECCGTILDIGLLFRHPNAAIVGDWPCKLAHEYIYFASMYGNPTKGSGCIKMKRILYTLEQKEHTFPVNVHGKWMHLHLLYMLSTAAVNNCSISIIFK